MLISPPCFFDVLGFSIQIASCPLLRSISASISKVSALDIFTDEMLGVLVRLENRL